MKSSLFRKLFYHKKLSSCFCVCALALSVVACKPESQPVTPTPTPDIPKEDVYIVVSTRTKTVTDPGSEVVVSVDCNSKWDYTLSVESFVEVSRSETELVLSLDKLSYEGDRKIGIKIYATQAPEVYKELSVTVKSALAFDAVFEDDGSAKDASSNSVFIKYIEGDGSVVYYNSDAGRNVARFLGSLGENCQDGYYKIDYSSGRTIKDALSDGHTLEVQFMLSEQNNVEGEVKMFSSMQDGGTGFLLSSPSQGRDITFLPNVSKDGTSNWCWAQSGVVPEVGKYYHVVGVWDKTAGKARVYVNGELKNEVDADGEFVFPTQRTAQWFCIGGDSSTGDYAESSWNGDVVVARIYDAVLRESDIQSLWQNADHDFSEKAIDLKNLMYLPSCILRPESEYTICGDGFRHGDKIRFKSMKSAFAVEADTKVGAGKIVVNLPKELVDGSYKISLIRGSQSSPIGNCEFFFSDNAKLLSRPIIVAHRGFHKQYDENSIAALQAAQQAGFDAVELDVWLTADGRLVVNHDGKWNGKTVQSSSYAELNGIPTLENFINEALKHTDTKLVIEIKEHSSAGKDEECTSKMLKMVNDMGYAPYAEYISFSLPVCKQIASSQKGAIVGYLRSTDDLQGLKDSGILCADFGYEYLFNNKSIFTTAHSIGMVVNAWTVNSDNDMKKAIGLGVDYITTDNPDSLKEILDRLF